MDQYNVEKEEKGRGLVVVLLLLLLLLTNGQTRVSHQLR